MHFELSVMRTKFLNLYPSNLPFGTHILASRSITLETYSRVSDFGVSLSLMQVIIGELCIRILSQAGTQIHFRLAGLRIKSHDAVPNATIPIRTSINVLLTRMGNLKFPRSTFESASPISVLNVALSFGMGFMELT
jgi:hypothetical protein